MFLKGFIVLVIIAAVIGSYGAQKATTPLMSKPDTMGVTTQSTVTPTTLPTDIPQLTPTPQPTVQPTTLPTKGIKPTKVPQPTLPQAQPTVVPQNSNVAGSFSCNCAKTCPNMSSCTEAQYQLQVCGCIARDADHDGIACDTDCQ